MTLVVLTRTLSCTLALCLALVGTFGCASDRTRPHRNLEAVWRDFVGLPSHRALVIAGNPARGEWVVGMAGGFADSEQAEAKALAECRVRRRARRMQQDCTLYATGKEIVWRGR